MVYYVRPVLMLYVQQMEFLCLGSVVQAKTNQALQQMRNAVFTHEDI